MASSSKQSVGESSKQGVGEISKQGTGESSKQQCDQSFCKCLPNCAAPLCDYCLMMERAKEPDWRCCKCSDDILVPLCAFCKRLELKDLANHPNLRHQWLNHLPEPKPPVPCTCGKNPPIQPCDECETEQKISDWYNYGGVNSSSSDSE